MQQIKIGGVPEHFNLPILLAKEEGLFAQAGIDLQWSYYPGGSGAMTTALADEELDLAILLTEGFVAAATKGLRAKIVKTYIDSPLVWGIYTGAGSLTQSLYDSSEKQFAISRFGSGSHLMALIHAEQRGEQLAAVNFTEVNSLEIAVESLVSNQTQIFYWEKLMTKKYVANGSLRLIGEFSARWSSFLIVATDKCLLQKPETVRQTLRVINEAGKNFKARPDAEIQLQQRFGLPLSDTKNWLNKTFWSSDSSIRPRGLQNALEALQKVTPTNLAISLQQFCVQEFE